MIMGANPKRETKSVREKIASAFREWYIDYYTRIQFHKGNIRIALGWLSAHERTTGHLHVAMHKESTRVRYLEAETPLWGVA